MPARGEIWLVDLEPVRGREQGRTRPALIVSADDFNNGAAGLVIVVPLTKSDRRIPLHVQIDPPEGGVREVSFAKCEDVRSISVQRLIQDGPWGTVSGPTMARVDDRMRIVLNL